jgi:hypothetical protein
LVLFCFDLYGQIGTSKLTKFTADAVIASRCEYLVILIEFEDVLGTKMHTDSASFAPLTIDVVIFQLPLCHVTHLSFVSVHPQTASFDPWPRFSLFCNPQNSALCLRLQKRSSLALSQNLPFVDGHYL